MTCPITTEESNVLQATLDIERLMPGANIPTCILFRQSQDDMAPMLAVNFSATIIGNKGSSSHIANINDFDHGYKRKYVNNIT